MLVPADNISVSLSSLVPSQLGDICLSIYYREKTVQMTIFYLNWIQNNVVINLLFWFQFKNNSCYFTVYVCIKNPATKHIHINNIVSLNATESNGGPQVLRWPIFLTERVHNAQIVLSRRPADIETYNGKENMIYYQLQHMWQETTYIYAFRCLYLLLAWHDLLWTRLFKNQGSLGSFASSLSSQYVIIAAEYLIKNKVHHSVIHIIYKI